MAVPANTVQSYTQVNIKEDLRDVIYDISPSETPFYSACKKGTAKSTTHEYLTDALRAAGANAHVEGDDTVAELRTEQTRLANVTQIFKNAVSVSGTVFIQGIEKWAALNLARQFTGKPS